MFFSANKLANACPVRIKIPKTIPLALIGISITLFKLYLISGQSLSAYPEMFYDDGLFLKNAQSIAGGHWLGQYNQMTLIKGVFYPLFIAASHLLHLPLLFAQEALYIGSCLVAIAALSSIIRRSHQRLIVFILLLFNPVSFSIHQIQREGIYPALTLLVVCCSLGLWLSLRNPTSKSIIWSVGLGFSIGAFWLTREEGIWIIPILFFLYILGGIQYLTTKEDRYPILLALCIPLPIWIITTMSISYLNWHYYNIFVSVETKEDGFNAAYGALSRIEHDHWQPTVPVPKEVRLLAYEHSPAFAELRPFLEGELESTWGKKNGVFFHYIMLNYSYSIRNALSNYFEAQFPDSGQDAVNFIRDRIKRDDQFLSKLETLLGGQTQVNEFLHPSNDNEIRGGWFLWALRDAVFLAGHYSDGKEASSFYQRIANEINSACFLKKLNCLPARSTLASPWNTSYLKPLFLTAANGMRFLVELDGTDVNSFPSTGTPLRLNAAASFTRENIFPSQYRITGWAWQSGSALQFDIVDANDRSWLTEGTRNLASEDVYNHFFKHGVVVSQSKNARFQLATSCILGCNMVILMDNIRRLNIPLSNMPTTIYQNGIHLNIDSIDIHPLTLDHAMHNWWKLRILSSVEKTYKLFLPQLFYLSLIIYVYWIFLGLKRRSTHRELLIGGILLVLIAVRVGLLSFIAVSSFPTIFVYYLSPLYPLIILFTILVFITFQSYTKGYSGLQ